ncbi:VSK receptor [Vibrio nitrifigilis]|uniref:VSK receptor n=1 Tax=Vibrio nitrifigilis TaxID=2789781 RepID=A0ABS0GJJ5_9VIBR|nr:VSK receptor [Vibrio nitrifigilis]MBF9000485.1 VSK receptor [Vibrio nitrifigilis]MBF9001578.1 VSK receptor [Vibrio nitrifigilis]MBF9002642.1 VSK receptor [Vibrio nitrifigilis]
MWDWIVELFNDLLEFFYKLFLSLVDALKDLFAWVFDQIFDLIEVVISYIMTLFAPFDLSELTDSIPSTAAWVLSNIGLPNCLVLIATAIGIRLVLQLIPFTRLGS